eukprot:11157655-Lingulodinium_polyedra.AAC.1
MGEAGMNTSSSGALLCSQPGKPAPALSGPWPRRCACPWALTPCCAGSYTKPLSFTPRCLGARC